MSTPLTADRALELALVEGHPDSAFAYAEALYVFGSLHHGGQGCEIYSALSRLVIPGRFRPAVSGVDLADNPDALEIYLQLCEHYGETPDKDPKA